MEAPVSYTVAITGSPYTVREKLDGYQGLVGFNNSQTKIEFGAMPNEMARNNYAAVAEEVLPEFKNCSPAGMMEVAAAA